MDWRLDVVPRPPFHIVPPPMMAVGYFFMKKLVFDLADEVFDAGDALIVRNKEQEARIALSNIMNVNFSAFTNPPRVRLSLGRLSVFGNRISSCPRYALFRSRRARWSMS
jgi:hypothetical protein